MAVIDSNFANFTYTPRSLPEDDTSTVSCPLPLTHWTVEAKAVQVEI